LKKHTFLQGVHPSDKKDLTENKAIEKMPVSSDYFISLSQHIGAPAAPIVNQGDNVAQGQLIAKANGKISANIFSSVSGTVVEILKRKNAQNTAVDYIHVKAEGDNKVALPKMEKIDKESILQRIFDAGIVGLGGAGFSTAVKDSPNKPVDILLINAAECEPYLNCDNRLMIEHIDEVLDGISLMATAIGVEKVIIGIEDNKMTAYEKLSNSGYEIKLLKKKYPQGAEKVLIYTCTKRRVPNKGGLPMDVGVVVHNVATAYAVYDAVRNNNPLYKRVLTVSGKGINDPKNLWVLNGTLHKDIFEFCGGVNDNAVKLISGGPMMGFPLNNADCSTTKAESGLLALTEDEINLLQPTNCISCGRCAAVCPMHLMPMYIDFYIQSDDLDSAVKYGAMDCFECGCCSFICPAKRSLVQSVRLAKQKMRERKK